MSKAKKQPVKQRIIDISLFGMVILGGSLLYGELIILKFTLPIFLMFACVFATGRYTKGNAQDFPYAELEKQRKKRVFSGCGNITTRENLLGY